LGFSLVLAFVSQIANLIAILSILLFYGLVTMYSKSSSKLKAILWVFVFCFGLALELHLIPGFKNLLIWNKIQLTPDAVPFTLYLNFDKTIVGLVILGLTLNLAGTWVEWRALLKQVVFKLPIIISSILILTIAFGYSKFEPKIPHDLWIWVVSNLLFTCVAEEGLFRGFVQESLTQLKYKYSDYVAILVPAIFFGIIHYPGGIKYVILATVAGALYGYIYKITKRIEASILTHFLLNLTHILLFTYPALLK
jgi:membrane protease YdiL (CAAX protease family)